MSAQFFDGTDQAKKIAAQTVKRAILSSTIILRDEIQTHTPVKTGRLRRSVRHRLVGNTGEVFTNVEYGPRVEYGFQGTDVRGRTYNQPPKQFMRKGAKAAEGKIEKNLQRFLKKGFKVNLGVK